MKRPPLAAVAVALAASLVLLAHEGHKALEAKGVRVEGDLLQLDPRTEKALGITSTPAREGVVEELLPVSARAALAPGARSFGSARATGIVTEVNGAVGDRVKAGDTLAVIESLELESLALQWRQAGDDLKVSEDDLKRAQSLTPSILPEQELEALRGAVDERRISAAAAEQRLTLAGVSDAALAAMRAGGDPVKLLPVLAPGDGIVVHVDVAPGQTVTPDRHLFEIDDDRELWVEADVPELFAGDAVDGRAARATFEAIPGKSFDTTLDRVAARVDPRTRTLMVAARLGAAPELRPGTPGRLDIIRRSAHGIIVPLASVAHQGLERFVFVALDGGHYRRQAVLPGVRLGAEIEIRTGLKAGEAVVVAGSRELSSLFAEGRLDVHIEQLREQGVRLADVDLRPVESVLRLPATLRFLPGSAGFVSTLAGGKVRKILAFPGDRVEAGAPLAELESAEVRAVEVDLIRSAARAALLDKRVEALRDLEKKGIAARKELLRVEAELRSERVVEQGLRAKLAAVGVPASEVAAAVSARKSQDVVIVRAAHAGVVIVADLSLGQVVDAGEQLFEIADPTALRAEGALSEAVLAGGAPAKGRRAVLKPAAYPELKWTAVVSATAPAVGTGNALAIWADVANPGGELREGMVAELLVVTAEPAERSIAAPPEALWPSGGAWYVFLQDGDTFRRQRVVPGRRGTRDVEILQGLFPGDRVAVSGLDELDVALGSLR
ncbi:MAG: efflux RND transporter periplasmic adaptor subunit [Planctomycetes bacterium]|nr:efflux RND transporter periplasmic adaptor subunit [Planctomycetota bacterium]